MRVTNHAKVLFPTPLPLFARFCLKMTWKNRLKMQAMISPCATVQKMHWSRTVMLSNLDWYWPSKAITVSPVWHASTICLEPFTNNPTRSRRPPNLPKVPTSLQKVTSSSGKQRVFRAWLVIGERDGDWVLVRWVVCVHDTRRGGGKIDVEGWIRDEYAMQNELIISNFRLTALKPIEIKQIRLTF